MAAGLEHLVGSRRSRSVDGNANKAARRRRRTRRTTIDRQGQVRFCQVWETREIYRTFFYRFTSPNNRNINLQPFGSGYITLFFGCFVSTDYLVLRMGIGM